ncbi:aminopeptidase N [Salinisphaera hydrothermalis]|uniref:Aminopeptidase N n=1 Tax=Salinisphaera hydrothermalis (strain C41B8) TaxID=1304275 RepID=A0A084IQB0_SALHC|nr:aminopeptidase N [Salinisphaera hydrothermalis]KEZ78894.1 aminopeptidase N [Salinisphaera hydrothermalis C41B8]
MTGTPQRKYRSDYQASIYLIDRVSLDFDIRDGSTRVTARHSVRRNPQLIGTGGRWWLDGRDLRLVSIAVDDEPVADGALEVSETGLWLNGLPDRFTLTVVTEIDPDRNLSLEGLYRSDDMLCTQCEATGFSRITYFPDRPDVMSRYTTRVEADAERYPVLLSNGNCIESGAAGEGRHYAVYEDPFAKPCYLFALVAGDLGVIRDTFTTTSGREVALALYTEHGNEDQCHHAMASLKDAMAWDEATYGLEYDLDSFVIVAVGSFNMGAMENKSLNIFNTACIFAHQDTATDSDFARVRDVVAHEYFHNYTGNRVTCRDWFQLSLKEGLTVYREHQFAIDHGSPGVTRIEQVRMIRDVQFPEDAGPRAHPVRPESYVEMNNFYTITVYEKGAELIRMMAQMAGREAFTKAVKHYLDKHDGQAVTIEDFVLAIEESTGLDLAQFRHWYAFAGTPRLRVSSRFADGRLSLELAQATPATPGQENKPNFDIPVSVALFDDAGQVVRAPEIVRLIEQRETFVFDGLAAEPTVSVLRGLTAPVRLEFDQPDDALVRLMAHDSDPVSRWDAAQSLYMATLKAAVTAHQNDEPMPALGEGMMTAVAALLADPPDDRALLAEMLTVPSATQIGEAFDAIDVAAVEAARRYVKREIAARFEAELERLADAHAPSGGYVFDQVAAGRRRVFATALDYLACLDTPAIRKRAQAVYDAADNMTDRMAALNALQDLPGEEREATRADFAERFADQPLVMDKWLRLQAATEDGDTAARVRDLLADDRFDFTNPNRVRALVGGFVRGNPLGFHRADRAGYALVADEILRLDAINPQLAAALAGLLAPWRRYAEPYAGGMREALARVGEADLSDNTREIVDAGLGDQAGP